MNWNAYHRKLLYLRIKRRCLFPNYCLSIVKHSLHVWFKVKPSPEKPVGFYLFDLDSTHGTQHNKRKCFPRTYYRLRVGHMLKFGGSTRTAILQVNTGL